MAFLLVLLLLCAPALAQAQLSDFFEVHETVAREFYDPNLRGVDWDAVRRELEPRARAASNPAELQAVIVEMLGRLKSSHTAFYGREQPEYYQLLGVFDRGGEFSRRIRRVVPGGPVYVGLGVTTKSVDGKLFVSGLFEGGPADQAGLLVGDELLAPLPTTGLEEGESVSVRIRRVAGGPEVSHVLRAVRYDGNTMFLDTLKQSFRVIPHAGRKIAYAHLWSYASDTYQKALEEALLEGSLENADAVVLDLRGGWGGATPEYLNLFNRNLPTVGFANRKGTYTFASTWKKPLVLLVDENSRSGKEILAYAVRKYGLGRVVGSRTGGAVLAGRPYLLKSGNVLYCAVADATVDGERLEGVGVVPDVVVERPLPYAAGADPQLEAALSEAARMASGASSQ